MTQTYRQLRKAADLLGKLNQALLGYKTFEDQASGDLYVPQGMDRRMWERHVSVDLVKSQKRTAWQEHIKALKAKLEEMGYVDETSD